MKCQPLDFWYKRIQNREGFTKRLLSMETSRNTLASTVTNSTSNRQCTGKNGSKGLDIKYFFYKVGTSF